MVKEDILVPRGVRYMSQWKEFSLVDFPHIMDKQIPGCGFTEWCLTNSDNVVLCSPRKILLQNKYDQHSEDVFLVINKYDNQVSPDKDLTGRIKKMTIESSSEPINSNLEESEDKFFIQLKNDIRSYICNRKFKKLPYKILVTYDSYVIVKEILEEFGESFNHRVVVDEFQSILVDSRFKSDVEFEFLQVLDGVQKVCYVSATPMLTKYLELLPEFRDLPYYRLDWTSLDPSRATKPDLKVRTSRSIFESAESIIKKYKAREFDYRFRKDEYGNLQKVFSTEAVIYVNSVNNIITILKRLDLKPEEVNILCANTPENVNRLLKKLGKDYKIGSIPLRGEKHKMFTFCTRTVYLGADFYSTNARTFVISDANIDSLAVDISLDLPQILGRQRLDENPWKNSAEFYYKTVVSKNKISQEEFSSKIEAKKAETKSIIDGFLDLTTEERRKSFIKKCEVCARIQNYKDDYVSIESRVVNGEIQKIPVVNHLVMIAELRAFDIQQIDYADRFTVFNTLGNTIPLDGDNGTIKVFLEEYQNILTLRDKLIFLCRLSEENLLSSQILDQITEKHFHEYLTILGPARIKALGYKIPNLNRELGMISFNRGSLRNEILKNFKIGGRYTLSFIKKTLSGMYTEFGYDKSPTASDLNEWFDTKSIQINTKLPNGKYKREHGYEIVSTK